MLKYISLRDLILIGLVILFLLFHPKSTYSQTRKTILKLVEFAGKKVPLPYLVGVASVADLGWDFISSSQPKNEIKIEFEAPPPKLELGLSMHVKVKVNYKFEDSWRGWDYAWLEIFVIADGKIVNRIIYPKKGMIEDPDAFLDDSEEGTFEEWVWIGAKEWNCKDGKTKVEIKAIMWGSSTDKSAMRDRAVKMLNKGELEVYDILFNYQKRKFVMVNTWEKYLEYGKRFYSIRAKDEKEFEVLLESPYFLEIVESENEADKHHHIQEGEGFKHKWRARMNYRRNYPTSGGIIVDDPQPPDAHINIKRLNTKGEWISWPKNPPPGSVRFIAGQGRKDEREYDDFGYHARHTHPHYEVYSDNWGAEVSGKNTIMIQTTEDESSETSEEYTWKAPFWLKVNNQYECHPIFQVTDYDNENKIPAEEDSPGLPTPLPETPTPAKPNSPKWSLALIGEVNWIRNNIAIQEPIISPHIQLGYTLAGIDIDANYILLSGSFIADTIPHNNPGFSTVSVSAHLATLGLAYTPRLSPLISGSLEASIGSYFGSDVSNDSRLTSRISAGLIIDIAKNLAIDISFSTIRSKSKISKPGLNTMLSPVYSLGTGIRLHF